MYLETTCVNTSLEEWEKLMKNAKPINYKWLVKKIKKHLPKLYNDLGLAWGNPFASQCCVTKKHYILVSSGIEYFINKSNI